MNPTDPAAESTPLDDRPASETPALRLRVANRDQVTPVPAYLDALLPPDHLARLVWQALTAFDLAAFYRGLVVSEGGPGRAAADPRLLVALWLYATSQGITSARELARRPDFPPRWAARASGGCVQRTVPE